MSTNGLISFGREVTNSDAVLFPSDTTQVSESYILAPFWADFNTNTGGSVFWWIEEAPSSSHVIPVTTFIQEEYGDSDFSATWVLVASWEDLTPVRPEFKDCMAKTNVFVFCREANSKLCWQQMVYQSLTLSIHTHVENSSGLILLPLD